ncbi:TNNT3 [Lepeophtheirus salmonis]|uniref:TNNT3 n=1 Tax=Lepeophtheirus salmonis TaxID=72036 RepID=A0A7R8D449_LEPSM|nr:TNNT3 [Lepeophtheirus salmonis]CAF3022923.1 TNNT3 [Lepeophtheirus salmonis]
MSDEEYYEEEEVEEYEEEYEEEETVQLSEKKSVRSEISRDEGDGNFLKARQEAKKGELDEQLKEYINEWRKQRSKEEEELKTSQGKASQAERDPLKRKKQQASGQGGGKGVSKKSDGGGLGNVQDARREMTKTKEQLEEEKKISLSIRIKPLDLDAMDSDVMRSKASELWDTIVRLETEKYDLEERQKRQDYDLKELKERQKQQLRQKAMKKGLDPEIEGKTKATAETQGNEERFRPRGSHGTDTRTYEDRRKLYEGGWEVVRAEHLQQLWKEKYDEWQKRPKSKLPKWFGERPGKKPGDPESPEDDEEVFFPRRLSSNSLGPKEHPSFEFEEHHLLF